MARGWVQLPERRFNPVRQILRRILYALIVLSAVAVLVMIERKGYRDGSDGDLDWLDAFYYATVTLSTTGYGDIVPVSDMARFTNIVVITPLRIAFLAILVGTTFQVLTRSYRDQLRKDRWREALHGHTVVIGYGTKGYNAIQQLKASGVDPGKFVIIDQRQELINEANRDGHAAILGDATRSVVLRKAGVPTANRVVIATNRDDTAVLATLTARQLNPTCVVVASIRESENEPLLLRSGADAVVTSSEAAGRLLGVAAHSPMVGEVFTDLLVHGDGLELVERDIEPSEVGRSPTESADPVIAVIRSGHAMTYREVGTLHATDRLVVVGSKPRLGTSARNRQPDIEDDDHPVQGLG
ncbi:MAG TPA: Ion channel protein [Micromonosporaceae bacterium]|nr:Ion channel protein [Micromonosporaceae bacterium]HCU51996.1 Ion channel protein [Micromonosporaceae bacterium]